MKPYHKMLRHIPQLLLVLAVASIFLFLSSCADRSSGKVKIGIVLVNDAEIYTLTRDGFVEEMKKQGFEDKKNCDFLIQSANGDIPTIGMILDNFKNEKVSLIVAVGTASVQNAIQKTSEIPIVFATVADPFIVGIGKSDDDHPANVTGIYGTAPYVELLQIVDGLLPNKKTIGLLWNPTFANSVHNIEMLKDGISKVPTMSFEGMTVAGTNDVLQATQYLANKKVNAFFLVADATIYDSFESIVKVDRPNKIPIFSVDVESLTDGATVVYGYDYKESGVQAAQMAVKILNGTSPKEIPFEMYKYSTLGVNLDVTKSLGIQIPSDLILKANCLFENGQLKKNQKLTQESQTVVYYVHTAAMEIGRMLRDLSEDEKKIELIRSYIDTVRFYHDKSGYFYVYNFACLNIAHATQKDLVGKNLYNYTDTKGKFVIRELSEAAKKGGDFVEFYWQKPDTKGEKKKLGYVEPISGTDYFIGSGVYLFND